MNLFQSLREVVGLPRMVPEAEFKKWRREATDPVIRDGACYVPIPGKEDLRFYRDKQNLHHLGRYKWAVAVLSRGNARPKRVLDCACGIGTQALGLASISSVACKLANEPASVPIWAAHAREYGGSVVTSAICVSSNCCWMELPK